ncbi:MAG: universal stress protein [Desulfobacterales bacterium]|nr:universal stress protein [Desulfobacterales bacterium]MDJ0989205.1 universal stress protein [Desulfobacterales bacterium]
MPIKKILWPTDLSGRAQAAMPYVTSLTERYDAEIHVLYVIDDLTAHRWYGEFEPDHIEKILAWEQKTARKRLDQLCHNHLSGCPLYVRHVAVGEAAREILKLVEAEKMDMVVMASRGSEGHFAFGSVAEKVVKNSPVPVVTIPGTDTAP